MLSVKKGSHGCLFCISAEDEAIIARFCDAIWLEDGLSEKTREAYRSDLGGLAQWLQSQPGTPLLTAAQRSNLLTWLSVALASGVKASTAARRLSGIRRFTAICSAKA